MVTIFFLIRLDGSKVRKPASHVGEEPLARVEAVAGSVCFPQLGRSRPELDFDIPGVKSNEPSTPWRREASGNLWMVSGLLLPDLPPLMRKIGSLRVDAAFLGLLWALR
jgi:hypothetical protein